MTEMPSYNARQGEKSFSNKTALVFLEAYLTANPLETIEELSLWETTYLSDYKAAETTVNNDKIMQGLSLSKEEAHAWSKVVKAIDQLRSTRQILIG